MLVLSSRFNATPILSLQTGTRIAQTIRALVDPTNLSISAFEVEGPLLVEQPSFLRINEIREIGSLGMIVDGSDELVGLNDVIKLRKLYDISFDLIGMHVITEQRQKLGKVEEYIVDSESFVIQQLRVKRGLFRGITDTGLLINRAQVISITDDEIIVQSTAKHANVRPVMEATRYEYSNPFRKSSPQTESSSTN
jgi:uncharacterized protein YrrD